jgi:glycosyltransferase involved in cell wall biosynthesis
LTQTLANIELIIIDDASTDQSWQIIESIQDSRVRTSRHLENLGAHATLNEGVRMARAEFIAILNSDDVYHPDRLRRLLKASLESDSTCSFAFTDVQFFNDYGLAVPMHDRALRYRELCALCGTLPDSAWFLAGNPTITTSNFFFSRTLADKVGEFSALRYTHDWDFALRAAEIGQINWIRDSLVQYRVHAHNTLSEGDPWRHIHENSYIQTIALKGIGRSGARGDSYVSSIVKALLSNESLHPVSLLCFLAMEEAGNLGNVSNKIWYRLSCLMIGSERSII